MRAPRESGRRRLLFLSRLHPKKGIDFLLRAWAGLYRKHPDWELVIAGPDQLGHRRAMQALAADLGLSRVVWRDAVFGSAKTELYRTADLFVLPTHAENFGLVVAEALAHGVPVITTTNSPWAGLRRNDCGWWIDLTDAALSETLHDAMGTPSAALAAMGSRGRAWMERDFAWPVVAREMLAVYRWMLGDGAPPSCVLLD
jgi:glycosyltransferase involved in cell wall biosynthesis